MAKNSKYQDRFAKKQQALHAAKNGGVIIHRSSDDSRIVAVEHSQHVTAEQEPFDATAKDPMAPQKVIFMSRAMASQYRFRPEDVCISITDTHNQPPEFFHKPKEVLHVAFHDHVTAAEEHHFKHRWATVEDGRAIVDFVLKHKDSPRVIVHCNYGQSRSKAAALAIAEFTGRNVLYANHNGYVVAYRPDDDSDSGNERVRSVIQFAHMEREGDD